MPLYPPQAASGGGVTVYQNTLAEYVGANVPGNGASQNVAALDLPAGTYTLIGTVCWSDGGGGLENDVCWIGPTSDSFADLYGAAPFSGGPVPGGAENGVATVVCANVVLAALTEVYLGFIGSESLEVTQGAGPFTPYTLLTAI